MTSHAVSESPMDRDSVEDVVHASLGRHLRVTCVLGLLLLGVGFVLGHFVAAQHARELSDRWSHQAEELARAQAALDVELDQVRELAQSTRRDEISRSSHQEEMLNETRRLAHAAEDLRQSLIARCIAENHREQARILQELQPYLDRKMTIQAAEVSEAVKSLVDSQVTQLKTLATVETPAPAPAVNESLTIRSNISPVSAESDAAFCPVPEPVSLDPVPDLPTPTDQQPIALMPMPTTPIVHMPVQAEPSNKPTALPSGQPQFFTAPRQPRLFIPARKSLEISSATDPVVR